MLCIEPTLSSGSCSSSVSMAKTRTPVSALDIIGIVDNMSLYVVLFVWNVICFVVVGALLIFVLAILVMVIVKKCRY